VLCSVPLEGNSATFFGLLMVTSNPNPFHSQSGEVKRERFPGVGGA
jgi:hypothetical protein